MADAEDDDEDDAELDELVQLKLRNQHNTHTQSGTLTMRTPRIKFVDPPPSFSRPSLAHALSSSQPSTRKSPPFLSPALVTVKRLSA